MLQRARSPTRMDAAASGLARASASATGGSWSRAARCRAAGWRRVGHRKRAARGGLTGTSLRAASTSRARCAPPSSNSCLSPPRPFQPSSHGLMPPSRLLTTFSAHRLDATLAARGLLQARRRPAPPSPVRLWSLVLTLVAAKRLGIVGAHPRGVARAALEPIQPTDLQSEESYTWSARGWPLEVRVPPLLKPGCYSSTTRVCHSMSS